MCQRNAFITINLQISVVPIYKLRKVNLFYLLKHSLLTN